MISAAKNASIFVPLSNCFFLAVGIAPSIIALIALGKC